MCIYSSSQIKDNLRISTLKGYKLLQVCDISLFISYGYYLELKDLTRDTVGILGINREVIQKKMNNLTTTESELEEILSNCTAGGIPTKCINYEGCFLLDSYPHMANSIENFEVRDDDVWVCSFAKAGTTWTQEMVWCIANNLDFEGAKVPITIRFPFLESSGTTTVSWLVQKYPEKKFPYDVSNSVEHINNMPSPRFIKTHLPFHLLPRQLRTGEKKGKIIYVARNPKDTCISYYHHYKILEGYCNTFENFCKLFLAGKVYFAPFWEHVIGFWQKKDEMEFSFIKYEDMKKDLPSVIRKTATYLEESLDDQQVAKLTNHLSFSSMKTNKATNYEFIFEALAKSNVYGDKFKIEGEFIRKGTVGQWESSMSKEMVEQFDKWTAEKLKNFDDLRKEFP